MDEEVTVECIGGPLDGQRVPYSGDVYDESRVVFPRRAGEETSQKLSGGNEVRTHRYMYDEGMREYRHQGRTE